MSDRLAVELDIDRDIVARKLPWVEVKPIVWNFDLVAIDYLLFEDTVPVTQSITPGWVVECCHAVKETGSQTTKTSVSKRCIMFLVDDIFNAEA